MLMKPRLLFESWVPLGEDAAIEIAGMVMYLASPEAGFVTGACLMIDGGFSA
jgi:NAD(P)-dependent dehydrogenase (short-subunit alcohol dehydrogenase family)